MITHGHLKTAIEDYSRSENKLLLLRLINELRYSALFIPSIKHDGKATFDIYLSNGDKLTPLFTDLGEVEKFYDEKVDVFSNSFELYRNVLKTTDIDGFIINPAGEKYLLKKDFVLAISDFPQTNYVSSNPYSADELKGLCDKDNRELEDYLKNTPIITDYETLFEKMSASSILTMMISETNLESLFKNDILNMQHTGPVASMYVDEVGGRYAAIFSSKAKMDDVKISQFKYAQIVNLSMLVNFVLSEDMDGIILNPSSDDVLIPRQKLLSYSLGFEKYANDERLSDSMYYIFNLHGNF